MGKRKEQKPVKEKNTASPRAGQSRIIHGSPGGGKRRG